MAPTLTLTILVLSQPASDQLHNSQPQSAGRGKDALNLCHFLMGFKIWKQLGADLCRNITFFSSLLKIISLDKNSSWNINSFEQYEVKWWAAFLVRTLVEIALSCPRWRLIKQRRWLDLPRDRGDSIFTISTLINDLISSCVSHQVSTERFLERSQQGDAGYRGQAFHTVRNDGKHSEKQFSW